MNVDKSNDRMRTRIRIGIGIGIGIRIYTALSAIIIINVGKKRFLADM